MNSRLGPISLITTDTQWMQATRFTLSFEASAPGDRMPQLRVTDQVPPAAGYTVFANAGVPWVVTPATGGTVTTEVAFKADWDKTVGSDWFAHGTHDSIAEQTGYTEDSIISALRFSATGAGAVVEVRSAMPIVVE